MYQSCHKNSNPNPRKRSINEKDKSSYESNLSCELSLLTILALDLFFLLLELHIELDIKFLYSRPFTFQQITIATLYLANKLNHDQWMDGRMRVWDSTTRHHHCRLLLQCPNKWCCCVAVSISHAYHNHKGSPLPPVQTIASHHCLPSPLGHQFSCSPAFSFAAWLLRVLLGLREH